MGRPKSDLLGGLGTWFEIAKAITAEVLALGGTDDNVRAIIKNSELKREIAKLIIAWSGVKKTSIESVSLVPSGWTVLEDVPVSDFLVEDLDFVSFLENGESSVGGEAMRRRAVTLNGNFGLADAPHFLANQVAIPVDLRGKYIVLSGTLLRDSVGFLRVPYLRWSGGQWVLNFDWLAGGWSGYGRIARRK